MIINIFNFHQLKKLQSLKIIEERICCFGLAAGGHQRKQRCHCGTLETAREHWGLLRVNVPEWLMVGARGCDGWHRLH